MAYSENTTPVNRENKDKHRNSADLLPLFFRTEANKKFLGSTLDSFISKGQLERLNGFVGARDTIGSKPSDEYIPEPTKNRRRYNLLPSVVIRDDFQDRTDWTGTYDDLINQLDYYNANTSKHNRLFDSKYYAWNPHIDFDKFVNYRQYYWLPQGPDPVTITGYADGTISTFSITNNGNQEYVFTPDGATGNPYVVLYRGATYRFEVNAPGHPFYIKNARTTGTSDQYSSGVVNNGAESGTVVFTVPIDAPDLLYYACGNHQEMQGILEIKNSAEELNIDITTEILGKVDYTSANGVVFTNGMKVNFEGDITPSSYKNKNFYVEGVGDSIKLIQESELDTPEVYSQNFDYEFDIDGYDDTPFDDAQNYPTSPEYITINRSSIDKNAWSRYNRWFHKSVIDKTAEYNNTVPVLDEDSRAKRPIIEFLPNLQLFNSATQGIGNIDLIDTVTTDAFSQVEGQIGYYVDEVLLLEGMRVTFNADPDITVKGKIYEVRFIEHQGKKRLHLEEQTTPLQGQGVVVNQGETNQGASWYFNGTEWVKGQQKTQLNQSPLFDLYDEDGVSYGDEKYGVGSFLGNEIVSYKIGTGTNDTVLGFPLTYQNINNVGDIVFEFDWDDSSFTFNDNGSSSTVDTARGLLKVNTDLTQFVYENGWSVVDGKLTQPVVQINDTFANTTRMQITSIQNAGQYIDEVEVVVLVDNKILRQNIDFTLSTGSQNSNLYIDFVETIPSDKRVITKIVTNATPTDVGYYEAPKNLTNNAENNDLQTFTLGSVTDHFRTILENDSRVVGKINGETNARDVKDIYTKGSRYVKHQGSLLPAIFGLVDSDTNIVKAIRKNAQDYNLFKQQFLKIADGLDLDEVAETDVDQILYKMSLNKTPQSTYYYSDMAGYGKTVSKLTYTVTTTAQKTFGIETNYSLSTVSDRAVYVYLNNEQLLNDIDYEFDSVDNTVTLKRDLNLNDVVKINDYNTVGNVIPNTPTKLGLYPKFKPSKFIDNTYVTPQTVIEGHDGSKTIAYGDYRDDLLLELEKRIYNNIKVQYNRNVFDINEHIPGGFRTNLYTRKEFQDIVKEDFGFWANFYGIDYLTNNVAQEAEPFTYNYKRAIDTVSGDQLPGYWKGIYKKFFDTDRPHTAPWEMIGYSEKPTWWENRYGPAPYTNGNNILWDDLERGFDFGLGKTNPVYARPGLSKIIPVDEYGDLLSPIRTNLVKNFITTSIDDDFTFGDNGPAEYAWNSSSWYPFAIQVAMAFMKPAQYLTSMFDTSQNLINSAGNLVYRQEGKIIDFTDVRINELSYNSVRYKGAGYHVFVTDYVKSFGKDIKESYRDRLNATSMNLVYKLGGFANKDRLRCLLESSNPQTADTSVFLPQENYEIAFRKSNPIASAKISGIIVEKTDRGYKVSGYDKYQPVFKIFKPQLKTTDPAINVGGTTAKFVLWQSEKFYGVGQIVQFENVYYRAKQDHTSTQTFDSSKFQRMSELPVTGGASAQVGNRYANKITEIPYNTVLTRSQDVVDLLMGYGKYLESVGFVFDEVVSELGEKQDYTLSSKEFLFWTTQNWSPGSVITLAPFSTKLKYKFSDSQVDNVLDSFYEYSILTADGSPLPRENINTTRQSGEFTIKPKNTSKGIFSIQLNRVQKEQVIVFDDKTIFGDVIYDQEAGYRQRRIKLIGFKSSEWNGDLYSPGFTYDEAQINPWQQYVDYNLGDVVKYKTKFYSAGKFIAGSDKFDPNSWLLLGNKPVAQILPNLDFKISSFEDFYNLDAETYDLGSAQLSQHLVGYQKRIYLDNLVKNDTAQYKFYQGFIKEKGTLNAFEKIGRIKVDEVQTDIALDEEWAFKQGSVGNTSTVKELEFILDEGKNVDNPQAYSFASNAPAENSSNVITLTPNNLIISPDGYANDPFPKIAISKDTGITSDYVNSLPVAGYPRLDKELVTAFSFDAMVQNEIIGNLNEGDSVWVAKDTNKDWNVYTLIANPARVLNTDDLRVEFDDDVVTFYTDIPHGLQVNQLINIKNFINELNGVYLISSVPGAKSFKVSGIIVNNLDLNEDSSSGEILEFISTRLTDPDNINDIKYITEFPDNTRAYADDDGTGKWAVYERNKVFTENKWGAPNQIADQQFGYNVATGEQGRLIVVSAPGFGDEGQIYILRREFNTNITTLQTVQGYAISDNSSDNIVTDSGRPALGFSLAVSNDSTVIVAGAPKASNFKAVDDSSRVGFRVSVGDFTADPSPYSREGVITIHTYDSSDNLFKRNYIVGSSDPHTNAHFGQDVLCTNSKIIVGAPGQNNYQGKLFIYDKVLQPDGSTFDWDLSDHHELFLPNSRDGDQFGYSLAGTSDLSMIAVGAIGVEAVADDSSASKGAVYVYRLHNNEYQLVQTIDTTHFASINSGDQFGYKVAMSHDGATLAISAPFNDTDATNAGSVYYFNRTSDDSSLDPYEFVQRIASPDGKTNELFGANVAVNPTGDGISIFSQGGQNRVTTTFDKFTRLNDSSLSDKNTETTFDAGVTNVVDENFGSGTVYTYTKLNKKFVFGQKINSETLEEYDAFGQGMAYTGNSLIIGAPLNDTGTPKVSTGGLFVYQKQGTGGWNRIDRQEDPVDVDLIKKAFTYNQETDTVKDFLETLDPVKGKIPYLAEAELTYKSETDPATYNVGGSGEVTVNPSTAWGAEHVGELWWDLSTVRYVWYEQGDIEYRNTNWGGFFPGSRIDVYEWVESDIPPTEWDVISSTTAGNAAGITGNTKLEGQDYTTKRVYDNKTGQFTTRYYYWVRDIVSVPDLPNRRLPSVEVANIIEDPKNYGIKAINVLDSNSLSLQNIKTTLDGTNVVLSLQYKELENDLPQHNEWQLIRPKQNKKIENRLLIKKLIDSLVGYDEAGNQVPDPALTPQRRYGIQIRPRQTMFVDRLEALKTLITNVNSVLIKERIVDTKDITRLNTIDPQPLAISGKYDVKVDEYNDLENIGTTDLIQATANATIVDGRITSATVVNRGYGYRIAPEIEIIGDGEGAKVSATLDSQGRVSSITVDKKGTNYTTATLVIRPFRVLVDVDSTANNYWATYQYNQQSKLWDRVNTQTFDVKRFWRYEDWKVDNFDIDSIINFKITALYELNRINPDFGDLVEVENMGDGNKGILKRVMMDGTFNDQYDIMYKAKSTIQINDSIFNYDLLNFGFAGFETFDINLFDSEPIQETRLVLEIIKDDIFVDDLKTKWNDLFFVAIRYIFAEQNFVDWAFKTSFINVKNNLGGFSTKSVYKVSDPGYFEEYIKEIKPYKSTIREYITAYDQVENTPVGTTDFDLPSYYDDELERFVVPKITDSEITQQPYVNWFDNYKYKVGAINVTNKGAGYSEPPIVVISGGRENKPTITQTADFRSLVTTDYNGSSFFVKTTSVPDHGFLRDNGINTVTTQNLVYQITRTPVEAQTKISTPNRKAIGVAVNGVVFYNPVGTEQENRNNVPYTINQVDYLNKNNIDKGEGSPDENGIYHYTSDPIRLYTKDDTAHSPLLGYALDGYPIYGPYGWNDPRGNDTPRVMETSYRLKTNVRSDGTASDGTYIEDYEYVVGLGDLDEHNGRFCNTPEYPNGTYAYFVTVDPNDTTVPLYPYVVGPTYYGVPILPNGNKTLPGTQITDATATAYTSRGIVREVIINNPGEGYVSAPVITLAGGGGENAVTETARAYAILENKKVRVNTINMKFDRLATSKVIQTETQTDTFRAVSGQIKFKLTYLPTLDKREIDININNETVYIENYDVSIVTATDATYSKKEGYVIFNTPPGASATVQITYKKSINLMQATDRIDYYYQPTAGMLGKDPAQLMTGVEYDGVQVQGLEFEISVGWDGLPWMSHGWDTFSGTNTDFAFRADGSTQTFTLPYVPENNQEINVYFDGVRQDPTNTATIVGDGVTDTFTLSVGAPDGTLVVFRQKESDGSLVPTDVNNLDTILQGGNFAYSTATGQQPQDISIDGDGFVTVDTSHAPEEVVPGQAFDSLSMSVYNAPADGSPIIETVRYWGNSLQREYGFNLYPGTDDSIFVTVDGEYLEQGNGSNQYQLDWQNKTVIFTDAPEIDELVSIQTLNIGGASILERKSFTGDGSTTEFVVTSNFTDVGSAFVTVNGVARTNVIRQDETGSAIVDVSNPPAPSGAVIQVVVLSSTEQTYSEIDKQVIVDDGSTTSYTLTKIPGNIAPYHAMVIAEMKDPATGVVTRLKAPDTIYYTSNGITQDFLASQNPGYTTFTLALGEIEVHLNGTRLIPIRDYNFDTATNLVSFNQNVLSSGDAIAITILRDHEYEINVSGDSAGDTEANFTVLLDRADIPANAEFRVTTFTNHDANLIRKEVYRGTSGGIYTLSRPALDSNYVWVEIDGVPLVADRDYKVNNNSTIYIDEKFDQEPSKRVVITSFSEDASYDTIGYRVFKDMLNRTHFKRISQQDSTSLATELKITDDTITLVDASFLDTPSIDENVPGVIYVDRERIEFYTINGNVLGQITRGTLGTGAKNTYSAGTLVFDGGPSQTVPYTETVNVYEGVIRPGLPNGRKEHVLETINISSDAEAHDQVEVYLGGRKLQKPTPTTNPIKQHDIEIAFDSNETNSAGTSSDVEQIPEFTIVQVSDSTAKNYYKLVLRDEPQDGLELKVVQKQGKVWYEQGLNSASTGTTLQRAETAQARFLLERTSGLPVINIRE